MVALFRLGGWDTSCVLGALLGFLYVFQLSNWHRTFEPPFPSTCFLHKNVLRRKKHGRTLTTEWESLSSMSHVVSPPPPRSHFSWGGTSLWNPGWSSTPGFKCLASQVAGAASVPQLMDNTELCFHSPYMLSVLRLSTTSVVSTPKKISSISLFFTWKNLIFLSLTK